MMASIGVITMFDLYLYEETLLSILDANIFFEKGTSQWMLYVNLLFGFFYGMVVDYRFRKSKKSSKSS
ncbi:hypothetical protein [Robertmurraya korlensis]|uniref:hypothetical protein n=1 Tax=Robertmurraya korlensis TaxID=519977 RepID=UPI00203A5B8C|nr:hypothetical protein [Robertmurraya korlensis]